MSASRFASHAIGIARQGASPKIAVANDEDDPPADPHAPANLRLTRRAHETKRFSRMDTELTLELERALLRELLAAWRQVNDAYFKQALRAPALELVASRAHLGRWMIA